jgi:dihydroorotase
VQGFDPVFKVNPPLRTERDVDAVVEGLRDGTIDAIATDHAPHAQELKEEPFDLAPPGMLGLETALPLALEALGADTAIAALTWKPARIAGIDNEHGGPIVEGAVANLCVIDPARTWTVDAAALASRSRNTPFAGRAMTGKARHTILRGEPVVVDFEAQR